MKSTKLNIKLLICIAVGLILWLLSGYTGAPEKGWHIFAVLTAVVISLILKPYPTGIMVISGLLILAITRTVTVGEVLAGFGESTVWLVVAAFMLADSVITTGLGKRIAYKLVSIFGKTTLKLAYAICFTELALGPVVPSNTARGGGVIGPVVNSLSDALGSTPEYEPKKAGEYLTLVGAHANLISSAMFLTGMAANPLMGEFVESIYGIRFGWETWALGAIVPGLVGLILLPLVLYKIAKPELDEKIDAGMKKRIELQAPGAKMSRKEKVLSFVLISMLALWSTHSLHGIDSTLVAWIGVSALVFFNVQKWNDLAGNDKAWDALIWLGGLITIAKLLTTYGFIEWFVMNIKGWVEGYNGFLVLIILLLVYFYSMYMFSSLSAHLTALAPTFLALTAVSFGYPLVAAALFAYFSLLCGCLTPYSTGPFIIYFGYGYVQSSKWFSTGLILSLFHLIVWFGVGMVWWKILHWW